MRVTMVAVVALSIEVRMLVSDANTALIPVADEVAVTLSVPIDEEAAVVVEKVEVPVTESVPESESDGTPRVATLSV